MTDNTARRPMDILIGSGNAGKLREIEGLFCDVPVHFRSLTDFPDIREVSETGSTFEENAVLKARGYALQSGLISLADDSGLEISALGNAPGVLSARYGGETTSFAEKMAMLLREMDEIGDPDRSARFVCSMAVSSAFGDIIATAEGVCEGKIAAVPRGTGGFGYDPMFVPAGYKDTFGELSDPIKREISHRARASRIILRYLQGFMAV